MSKKRIYIRITKLGTRRYRIEERKKFLMFWNVWEEGSSTLGLPKLLSHKNHARDEILRRAKKKGIKVNILFYA